MKVPSRWFVFLTTLLVAVSGLPFEEASASNKVNKLKRSAKSAAGALYNQVHKRPPTLDQGGMLQAQQAQTDRERPLEGMVEKQSESDLVDVNQFNGQASEDQDGFRLPRNAGINSTQLRSGADANELRAGTARPGAGRPGFALNGKRTRLQGDVSDKDLLVLGKYDVVVMQDRSSSMGEDERIMGRHGEGFRKMSRWDWCVQEAADFTRQTGSLRDWFFTLVLFSSKYDVHHRVMLNQIPYIYSRSGIFIGTRLADPMAEQISMHFKRREMGEKRPLLIAVITDGKPQDDENLRDVLIQTTYQMRDPNEVKVVFLQIGTDDDGSEKLIKLDSKLQRKGAKFDIVSVKPFYEILNVGLTRALVETIQRGG